MSRPGASTRRAKRKRKRKRKRKTGTETLTAAHLGQRVAQRLRRLRVQKLECGVYAPNAVEQERVGLEDNTQNEPD